MKTDLRRYAPLGLVLSLLAALGFIVILLLKGLATASIFTLPDPKVLDQALWISLALFVLGPALAAFLDPDGTRKFLTGRQAQYGSNSFIMLAAFLGVLFFINFIAYQNPMKKDVTEDQQNSLAPETISMLAALPEPVTVRAYYASRPREDAQKLLDNYKQHSNGKLTYEFIDQRLDPLSAQNDGVTGDGIIVMHMAGRKETVTFASEQELDGAIVRLINPEKRVIYFLTGHGERDTENPGETSLTQAKATLQNKNYTVNSLNLNSEGKVPADAETVIIAGPQKLLSTEETAWLEAFLDQGGSLIVMQDPRPLTEAGPTAASDPLDVMLAKWGVSFENDLLVDPGSNPPLFVYADPQNYGQHPISEKLRGIDSVFFTVHSIKIGTPPEEIIVTPLAKTYPNTWGETDLESNESAFDPATDIPGPLVMAAAAENTNTKGRLVVFGDSEFAGNTLFERGSGDILINAVDWAAQQENLISLTPKNNIARTFDAPASPVLIGIILLSICVIPLLIVIAGVAAWYSRRLRG